MTEQYGITGATPTTGARGQTAWRVGGVGQVLQVTALIPNVELDR
jgi:hypothetical protein